MPRSGSTVPKYTPERTPASAAASPPIAKTSVNALRTSIPSAVTIARFSTPARSGGVARHSSFLVPHAVFQAGAVPRAHRVSGCLLNLLAIFGMDLFKRICAFQFFVGVTKNLFVRRAVIKSPSLRIYYCDHIDGIFSDKSKQLLTLNQMLSK